jgi:hypothetical protein
MNVALRPTSAPALTRVSGMAVSNATRWHVLISLQLYHTTIMTVSVAWH